MDLYNAWYRKGQKGLEMCACIYLEQQIAVGFGGFISVLIEVTCVISYFYNLITQSDAAMHYYFWSFFISTIVYSNLRNAKPSSNTRLYLSDCMYRFAKLKRKGEVGCDLIAAITSYVDLSLIMQCSR